MNGNGKYNIINVNLYIGLMLKAIGKWAAVDGRDNAFSYKRGAGWSDLNRTKGNEVLYYKSYRR